MRSMRNHLEDHLQTVNKLWSDLNYDFMDHSSAISPKIEADVRRHLSNLSSSLRAALDEVEMFNHGQA